MLALRGAMKPRTLDNLRSRVTGRLSTLLQGTRSMSAEKFSSGTKVITTQEIRQKISHFPQDQKASWLRQLNEIEARALSDGNKPTLVVESTFHFPDVLGDRNIAVSVDRLLPMFREAQDNAAKLKQVMKPVGQRHFLSEIMGKGDA